MKNVEFVRVESQLSGYGFGKGVRYSFEGVETVIREMARKGWSYRGYIPLVFRGTGDMEAMNLVFEKEE